MKPNVLYKAVLTGNGEEITCTLRVTEVHELPKQLCLVTNGPFHVESLGVAPQPAYQYDCPECGYPNFRTATVLIVHCGNCHKDFITKEA